MKTLYFSCLFLLVTGACGLHKQKGNAASAARSTDAYDSLLAKQYGADDYGMKTYYIAFLKAGPNRIQDSAARVQLQRAHMDNIGRLAEAGKLIVAGPLLDKGDLRGIYIFDVATEEEARKLTESDPAVQAGSLVLELHPWYGSAAMMAIPATHKKVAKNKI